VGYRHYDTKDIEPLFPFGFGLSYTTFAYSNLKISSRSTPAGSPVLISLDVENTGSIAGEEVVQLYLSNSGSPIWMPEKELKGFDRLSIAAGEKKTVYFNLTADEFYYWDMSEKAYKVNPGNYIIQAGGSSSNLPLSDTITLTSSSGKPDLRVTEVFTMPRYPKKGDQVYFYALVKNQGNAALTSSDIFNISFSINDSIVAQAENVGIALSSGNVKLIGSSGSFKATSDKFILHTIVDKGLQIDEWIEDNNSYFKQIGVPGPKQDLSNVNIALNKTVTSSSNKDGSNPSALVDGNKNSRWESVWQDSQWICTDLGSSTSISKVILNWESAYASGYSVQVSEDSISWSDVFTTENGNGGIDTISFEPRDARYVRINLKKRFTEWGFSLYEIEIYPAPVKANKNINRRMDHNPAHIINLPNGCISVNSGSGIINKIVISDLQGRSLQVHNQRFSGKLLLNVRNLRNGLYIINCTGPAAQYRQKLLIRK